jgi:hypothetical protein
MRTCPSVEGSAPPLITHRIGVDVCMARQRTFFHKCHRCIYRGQAANWEPEVPPMATLEVHAAEEPHRADVRTVELGQRHPPRADKARPKGKPAKARPDKVRTPRKTPPAAAADAVAAAPPAAAPVEATF